MGFCSQAEDGIRNISVPGFQTSALPTSLRSGAHAPPLRGGGLRERGALARAGHLALLGGAGDRAGRHRARRLHGAAGGGAEERGGGEEGRAWGEAISLKKKTFTHCAFLA